MQLDSDYFNGFDSDHLDNYIYLMLAFVVVLIWVLSVLPYGYGIGDQTTEFPAILHVMDNSYFASDQMINTRGDFTSPRYFYIQFVAALTSAIGLFNSTLLLYLLSSSLIIFSLYKLYIELFDDRFVALSAIGLILSPATRFQFGGNQLFYSYLTPSHLAAGFIILGILLAVRKSYTLGFILLGIATIFHPSDGLIVAVVVGISIVIIESGNSIRSKNWRKCITDIPWIAAISYGIISSVVLLPLAIASGVGEEGSKSLEAALIMAYARHPQLMVPSLFIEVFLYGAILITITAIVLIYLFRGELYSSRDISNFSIMFVLSIVLIMIIGYIAVEILYIAALIKIHPFHVDKFMFVFIYGALIKGGYLILSRYVHSFRQVGAVLTMIVLITGTAIAIPAPHHGLNTELSIITTPDHDDSLNDAYEYIRYNTPQNSVFLAPTEQNGFRLGTQRARVVNDKVFPFQTHKMIEWKERMDAVCTVDVTRFAEPKFDKGEICNSYFFNSSQSRIEELAQTYNTDYILTTNKSYNMKMVYENDKYAVYQFDKDEQNTAKVPVQSLQTHFK